MTIKRHIFLSLIGIGLFVGGYVVYQKKQCSDCVWISQPIEFSHVVIQGEVTRKILKALSIEEKKSFSKSVNNCRDFWKKGLPQSNYMESKAANYYRGFCDRLKLLQQVKPAKENYFRNFTLMQTQFLPPTIVTSGTDDYDAPLVKAQKKGESLQTLIEQKIVSMPSGATDLSVKFVYQDMQTQLIEIARGDFDGDGLEDILIELSNHSIMGSYGFYGSLLLKRTSHNGMIEVKAP